jgi:hypothetical protein
MPKNNINWKTWVLGIAATAFIAISSWASTTIINHGEKLATLEANYISIKETMERIEKKLDRINK